jgi:hypothetical protein
MEKDDTLSSSQLRQRYQKGGELRDDQLTAAQLRARYGLTSNSKEFSTSEFVKKRPIIIQPIIYITLSFFAIALLYLLYTYILSK